MSLKDKRIFMVEDDYSNMAVIETLLKEAGAIITFEKWGNRTLTRLAEFTPVDAILLDLMLPLGISGFQLYDMIRADAQFANVPIVAVSAADPAVAMKKARQVGFSGFISKPINHEVFADQIASIIGGQSVWYAN